MWALANSDERTPEQIEHDAFLHTLLSKRKEAVAGRQSTGIETEWTEDEEHYAGIDDANRHIHASSQLWKSRRDHLFGGGGVKDNGTRSVIFPNITQPYCDAGAARVADMLLPTDDRSWAIKSTPIPNLDPAIEEMPFVLEIESRAKDAAERMQHAIDDCLTESGWHGEIREVIEDAARIGSGVIKGPIPMRRVSRMTRTNEYGMIEMVKETEIRPGSKRVDPWNLFPDPSCGENIHDGSYIWEREYMSRRGVKEMLEMPGYDVEAIRKALKEGPAHTHEGVMTAARRDEDQFELWIFHGHCMARHLSMMGVELEEDEDERLPTMAVILNDRIVNITLSPIESGEFPYDVLAWQRRPGLPWGVGIARQIRTAQRMLTGNTRALMDNLGLAAAPQIVYGNGVTPEDGIFSLRPGKQWRLNTDFPNADVRSAFATFHVNTATQELMKGIELALRLAEDTTGMPAMLQGIRGDAPNTLGGMQMQNNNANSVLRRIAKRFDDYITRPHITRYFEWMMQYSDDDSIKGDFAIDVRASSALMEREAQTQWMMQMLQAVLNPVYGVDPRKLMIELVKGQRIDPERFMLNEEEYEQQQQAMQQAQQPQPDPLAEARAQLAQVQAQTESFKLEHMQAQIEKLKAETATKNVEGMYSATQAAKNVAMAASLAGAADAIWKSAGGEDKDGSPAIGAPMGAPEQMPMQEPVEMGGHTNPMTPDNPAAGLQDGIEGGEQEIL